MNPTFYQGMCSFANSFLLSNLLLYRVGWLSIHDILEQCKNYVDQMLP